MMRRLLGIAAGCLVFAGPQAQDSPLSIEVITSSPASLNTNFTLIMGTTDVVLVDVPFLRSDAYRLLGDILDTGRDLRTIVITHAHPDHYFSVDVFKQEFPNVEVIAAPAVVDDIWRGFPDRLAFWGPRIGANAPRFVAIPDAFERTAFAIEGHTIEILGPMQGDTANATAIYVPELEALVAGDIAFNGVHVGSGGQTPAQRAAWIASLEQLLVLEPEIVVAGHTKLGMPNTRAALEYTRDYLARFEAAVAEASSAEELMTIMRREYPDAMDFQGDFLLTSAARSAMQQERRRAP